MHCLGHDQTSAMWQHVLEQPKELPIELIHYDYCTIIQTQKKYGAMWLREQYVGCIMRKAPVRIVLRHPIEVPPAEPTVHVHCTSC